MKIICHGKANKPKEYLFVCTTCDCRFIATELECMFRFRNHRLVLECRCPECYALATADEELDEIDGDSFKEAD